MEALSSEFVQFLNRLGAAVKRRCPTAVILHMRIGVKWARRVLHLEIRQIPNMLGLQRKLFVMWENFTRLVTLRAA